VRSLLVAALALSAACSPAPAHPYLLETRGDAKAMPRGSGARAAAPPADAGSDGTDGGASWCDTLASCCATLDPLDPARGWCEDAVSDGHQDVCATRMTDMAASGWCE
jgi:hypothetical protein